MHICHVTAHLPPDQAANALLPVHLGAWAVEGGDHVSYVAYRPRAGPPLRQPGPVSWVPERVIEGKIGSMLQAAKISRAARTLVAGADLVHVHSNGLLTETVAMLAFRQRKPVVLTLYGTEIWHYRPRRFDLFTRVYRRAAQVTFYSQGLLDKARELGLDRDGIRVVYPPVAPSFTFHDPHQQAHVRTQLGVTKRHLLVNVKRLHPLAGQRYLIEALGEVIRVHPDTMLVICGTGALRQELEHLAEEHGVSRHVHFTGLIGNDEVAQWVAAADWFVLPSLLEALPTVALEALASGTPVVSADHPGGVELHRRFGDDVTVVPREDPRALAQALVVALEHKRRTRPGTGEIVEQEFRADAVARRYRSVYAAAMNGG